jgi:hypothetical protein
MSILASVRKLSIIFLSLFLTYAGVAWALEACLRHDGYSHSPALVDHDSSQDPSVPVIHCTTLTQQVGPAARVSSPEISRSDKYAVLYVVSLFDAFSAALKSNLWLDAVFRRIVTISLPSDLARHLFLSVLQI